MIGWYDDDGSRSDGGGMNEPGDEGVGGSGGGGASRPHDQGVGGSGGGVNQREVKVEEDQMVVVERVLEAGGFAFGAVRFLCYC